MSSFYEPVPMRVILGFQLKYERSNRMALRYMQVLNPDFKHGAFLKQLTVRECFENYKKLVKLFWLAFMCKGHPYINNFFNDQLYTKQVGWYLTKILDKYLDGAFCPRISTILNRIPKRKLLSLFKISEGDLRSIRKTIRKANRY